MWLPTNRGGRVMRAPGPRSQRAGRRACWGDAEVRYELRHGEGHVEGIVHYVRTQAANAEPQVAALPATGSTSGTGGLTFPAVMAPPPAVR